MAKRECIGKMTCPECAFPDAEVKPQKTEGLVYRWCPDCNAQYFCRTPEASARLLAKIGKSNLPDPVQDTEPEKKPAPAPAIVSHDAVRRPPKISSGMAGALELLGVKHG